jgi:hypothetical protein
MKTTTKKIATKTPAKKVVKKKQEKDSKVEKDFPIKIFTCQSCKQKYFDIVLYFYDKPSKKCLWCTKFPSRNLSKT